MKFPNKDWHWWIIFIVFITISIIAAKIIRNMEERIIKIEKSTTDSTGIVFDIVQQPLSGSPDGSPKSCSNCLHKDKSNSRFPCDNCYNYARWESA